MNARVDMNVRQLLVVSCALTLVSACAPRRIPGTEIDDTDDTRAILGVMEKYRTAVERKDAQQIITLVSDSFKDDLGTPAPDDDLDFARLRERLPGILSQVDDPHLEMTVRKIEIIPADKTLNARAVFTYTTSFRMPGLSSKRQSDSEIKEMWFARVGEDWKIVSGI
jgi:hypothetical protein